MSKPDDGEISDSILWTIYQECTIINFRNRLVLHVSIVNNSVFTLYIYTDTMMHHHTVSQVVAHNFFFNLVFINIFEILGFSLEILKKVSNISNFVCNLSITDPLDGVLLPTTPSTGCQVLDSWRVPATEIVRVPGARGPSISQISSQCYSFRSLYSV